MNADFFFSEVDVFPTQAAQLTPAQAGKNGCYNYCPLSRLHLFKGLNNSSNFISRRNIDSDFEFSLLPSIGFALVSCLPARAQFSNYVAIYKAALSGVADHH